METISNYLGSLLAVFCGVIFIPIGLPLFYKKIKRNYFYGFRLKYTLEDDDIWYEVNKMLGKHMVIQGIVLGLIGALSFLLVKGKITQTILAITVSVLLFVFIGYSLVKGIKIMNTMAVNKGLKK